MTKILLTRHGHVEGIMPERFRGREPLELTPLGRRQATAIAQRIAGAFRPQAIYTSPLGRCVETATVIAKGCGIEFLTCDELNDIDYGTWQFKTYAQARELDPALFAAWFVTPQLIRFPNGDALQNVVARTAAALRMILARHPDGEVVLVGHDNVNRALLLQLLDQPLSAFWRIAQDPCCLNEIDIIDGRILVRRINETRHLET